MRKIVPVFALVAVAMAAQTLQFSVASQDVIEKRLEAYVRKNSLREVAIRQIFDDAGCSGDAITEQVVKGLKFQI